jgi:hypothetical protein
MTDPVTDPTTETKSMTDPVTDPVPETTKCAYVTLVMGNNALDMKNKRSNARNPNAYVKGAIVTCHSIKLTGATHDVVCMVTPDVSATGVSHLNKVFDRVITVQYISVKTRPMRNKKIESIYGSWKSVAYTKWRVLEFVEYSKVLFVDADMTIDKNIDHLFDLPAPAGTFSMSQAYPFAGNGRGVKNPYHKLVSHGELVPHECIKQAFTKGMFVVIGAIVLLEPDMLQFKAYIDMINSFSKLGFGMGKCISGVDEQSITWLYHTNNTCKGWTHIHQRYNMIPWKQKNWLSEEDDKSVYVSHYVGVEKPWVMGRDKWPDLVDWWKFADSTVATYPTLKELYSGK